MGLIDKIKALFSGKKKDAKAASPAGEKKEKAKAGAPAKMVDQFKGEGKVADALRYGAAKIDAKLADGTLDEKKAALFMAQLKDCEAAQVDDDAKLVSIGQVIGAITFL